ncbi:MAG: sigma-70 family RNA polymerase sigma factor [Polyangiaceae bacterium]
MLPEWLSTALAAAPAADADALRAYVQQRSEHPEALDADRVRELALCFLCLAGNAGAVKDFEARYVARVKDFVRRIDSSAAFADEVQQVLRERMLAGPEPKLGNYSGRGSLEGFLRVSATRIGLELHRRNEGVHEDAEAVDRVLDDPELDHIKRRYSQELGRAFADALTQLGERERTVLSLNLIDGLNIDRIGQLMGVHRATVARWIKDARERLYDDTQARLQAELALNAAEFASLARLVQSQLDVSVIRILNEGRATG